VETFVVDGELESACETPAPRLAEAITNNAMNAAVIHRRGFFGVGGPVGPPTPGPPRYEPPMGMTGDPGRHRACPFSARFALSSRCAHHSAEFGSGNVG
jgi:hypothetical protein